MKTPLTLVILGLLIVCLSSCSYLDFGGPKDSTTEVASKTEVKKLPMVPPTAIWYLFTHDKVTLYLKNLDNGMPATMIIGRGLTQLSLPEGHWELSGFEEDGNSFTSMNTSKKFVFRVKSRTHVYAGSIVIGCPKVGSSEFPHLKSMKYFDRYPFSSTSRLCEIIIGNDFNFVKQEFQKRPESRGLSLTLGF